MDTHERDRSIIRQKSFDSPKVNPFVHEGFNLTLLEKIQIALMSVTIAPIRFILMLLSILVASLMASLITFNMPLEPKTPVRGWRLMAFYVIRWIGRAMFFFIGFHRVEIKGERADVSEALVGVAAPHSSFLDVLLWFVEAPFPSTLSRIENAKAFGFMSIMKTVQPVLVERDCPSSRQNAIDEIRRRTASHERWPQIIIFPEGTCTNRKALIRFKAGAFIPGVPVQPILLRYPDRLDTFSWTMKGPDAFQILWLSMCQFQVRLQFEFLPVYYPSDEEKKDPKLYAENVRLVMAEALGVPCTDHSFEDCKLMSQAKMCNLPMETGLVEFAKLYKKLGIGIKEMRIMLHEFAMVARSSKDGMIGIDEFAQHLKLPITKPLEEIFNMYDRDGSGKIDFREYVIGLSLVSQAAVTENTVKLAFKVFDRDGDGLVSREELDHVLKSVFGPELDTGKIFEDIDEFGIGKIDYDRFYAFAKKRPEYTKLFVSYNELQNELPQNDDETNLPHLRSSRVQDQPASSNKVSPTVDDTDSSPMKKTD